MFSVTTNGTIMNEEIIIWLIQNKVILKISLDGKEEVKDRNRISDDVKVYIKKFSLIGSIFTGMKRSLVIRFR